MNRQRDKRDIFIPTETIVEEQPRRLPFAYLRTWLVGLLALLLIPLGVTLILTGQVRDERLERDWVEAQAQIISVDEGRLIYQWDVNGSPQQNVILLDWAQDASASVDGAALYTLDLCAVAVRTVLPNQPGGEDLTIWYNPDNPKQSDCLPVTVDTTPLYTVLGWGALLVAGWFLGRIFHGAGMDAGRKRAASTS